MNTAGEELRVKLRIEDTPGLHKTLIHASKIAAAHVEKQKITMKGRGHEEKGLNFFPPVFSVA